MQICACTFNTTIVMYRSKLLRMASQFPQLAGNQLFHLKDSKQWFTSFGYSGNRNNLLVILAMWDLAINQLTQYIDWLWMNWMLMVMYDDKTLLFARVALTYHRSNFTWSISINAWSIWMKVFQGFTLVEILMNAQIGVGISISVFIYSVVIYKCK